MSELTDLTRKLLAQYFLGDKENIFHLFNMLKENSSIIGTGKHEFYKNPYDFKNAVAKELQERKDIVFRFEKMECEEVKINEDSSLVYGSIIICWNNEDRTVGINIDSRFSILFKRENLEWKILHIHLSTPNTEQMAGEYYLKSLIDQVESARETIKSLTKLASADSLTGLINLRTLKEKYQQFEKKDAWLFVIDIDNFKNINDRYGHLRGDHVLIRLAEILTHTIRERDLVCRMGGDEFILLCGNIKEENAAEKLAERLLKNVLEEAEKHAPSFAVSVGITRVVEGESFEQSFIRADHALYASKQTGKGKFTIEYQ